MLQSSTVPGVQFRNAWIKPDPFIPGAFSSEAVPSAKANDESMRVKAYNTVLPKPVLYWPCDGTPTQTHFKVSGGRYVEGAVGKGIRYDGNQHTEIVHALPQGKSQRTVGCWMRNDLGPVDRITFPITYGPIDSGKVFGIISLGKTWRFYDLAGGLDTRILVDKEWHHHVVTYDGKSINYYFDGKFVYKVNKELSTESGTLKIGGLGGSGNNFLGIIDEVYIYDVALSDLQVYKLFWMR